MGQTVVKNPRKVFSQASSGGGSSADALRITNLENNEYKILYFETISTATGTITKPVGSTIILDQFYAGGDAVVETLSNGQPTGQSPITAGGAIVSVSSFDTLGNYTLSGTPSAYPVALVYIFKIKAIDYPNVVLANQLGMESTLVDQTIIDGSANSVSGNAVFDGLATKEPVVTILSPAKGGTGVNNGVKLITLGGNLTTTGAFNTTLVQQANTTITLPPVTTTLVGKTGVAVAGQVSYYADADQQATSTNLTYSAANKKLTITGPSTVGGALLATNNGYNVGGECAIVANDGSAQTIGLGNGNATCYIYGGGGGGMYLKGFGLYGVRIDTCNFNSPLKAQFGLDTISTLTAKVVIGAGTAAVNTAPLVVINGTRETTARGGLMEYENNWYKTNNSLVRYGLGGTIFDFIADVSVGGAETDIFSSTLIASTFAVNKDKIVAIYSGNFVTDGTELTQLKVYLAGTEIWDSTGVAPSTGTTSWRVTVELMRKSSTIVLYTVSLNTTGASGFVYCKSGELAGLTLTNTNILKITGLSSGVGSGAGDIVGKQGTVDFKAAS